ncbi:MAG: hypothetical protein AB7I27_07745 [Bacteriovoracaceae bacterium]
MKRSILTLVVLAFFSNLAMAVGETKTQCPFMREDNSRSNPKAALAQKIISPNKPVKQSSASAQ